MVNFEILKNEAVAAVNAVQAAPTALSALPVLCRLPVVAEYVIDMANNPIFNKPCPVIRLDRALVTIGKKNLLDLLGGIVCCKPEQEWMYTF